MRARGLSLFDDVFKARRIVVFVVVVMMLRLPRSATTEIKTQEFARHAERRQPRCEPKHVTEKVTIGRKKLGLSGVWLMVIQSNASVWSSEVMYSRSRSKVNLVLVNAGVGVLVEVRVSEIKHARRDKQLQE